MKWIKFIDQEPEINDLPFVTSDNMRLLDVWEDTDFFDELTDDDRGTFVWWMSLIKVPEEVDNSLEGEMSGEVKGVCKNSISQSHPVFQGGPFRPNGDPEPTDPIMNGTEPLKEDPFEKEMHSRIERMMAKAPEFRDRVLTRALKVSSIEKLEDGTYKVDFEEGKNFSIRINQNFMEDHGPISQGDYFAAEVFVHGENPEFEYHVVQADTFDSNYVRFN